MNKPQKKGVIDERPRVAVRRKGMREVSAAQTQISLAYSRAIAVTAEHYKMTIAIEEMGGVNR